MSAEANEPWNEVPTHAGYYASADGALRGPRGLLRPMAMPSGHLYVITNRRPRKLFVHRAVLLAFIGPPPEGCECRHLDGDPSNNSLAKLAWGTRIENAADTSKHGRRARGACASGATLTPEQVSEVRASRESSRAIARRLGVSHTTIQKARRVERYAG